MKKRIFLGAGTLALAAVAVFAGRASSKFTGIVTLYYKNGLTCASSNFVAKLSNAGKLVTAGTVGVTNIAQLTTTVSNTSFKLYYTSTCGANQAVYFKP